MRGVSGEGNVKAYEDDEVGEELADTSAGTSSLLGQVLPHCGVRLQASSRELSRESGRHSLAAAEDPVSGWEKPRLARNSPHTYVWVVRISPK